VKKKKAEQGPRAGYSISVETSTWPPSCHQIYWREQLARGLWQHLGLLRYMELCASKSPRSFMYYNTYTKDPKHLKLLVLWVW